MMEGVLIVTSGTAIPFCLAVSYMIMFLNTNITHTATCMPPSYKNFNRKTQ